MFGIFRKIAWQFERFARANELIEDLNTKVGGLSAEIHILRDQAKQKDLKISSLYEANGDLTSKLAIAEATTIATVKAKDEQIASLRAIVEGFRSQAPGIHCDPSELDANTIKDRLKLADKYTLSAIMEWLKLDTYELVRKIAGTVNSDNAAQAIAFRDGAISRNQALIATLGSIKGLEFPDRQANAMRKPAKSAS